MASVKYSRLPMSDVEDNLTFDYTSAFSFEERGVDSSKYQSVFTFENKQDRLVQNHPENGAVSGTDRFARFMVTFGFYIIYLFTFPIMVWFSFKKVPVHQRFVIFRLGRLHKAKGPGVIFTLPILDRCHKVDVTLRAFSVPPKQVITEDGGIIEVGAEIYFQVKDAEKSVTHVQNLDASTRVLLQTSLCNILSQKTLADIETERRAIAQLLMVKSNKVCVEWGLEISKVELSQIKVLSKPEPKKNPTFMMPPGLFGGDSGDKTSPSQMPSAFAQLASALLSANPGSDQAQAVAQVIPQVMQAFTKSGLTPVDSNNEHRVSMDNQESTSLVELQSSTSDITLHTPLVDDTQGAALPMHTPLSDFQTVTSGAAYSSPLAPAEILCSIQNVLCSSLVNKIKSTYQFEICGEGGGTYFLDLKIGDGCIGYGPDPSGDPDATLTLTFDDLQAMLADELQPFQAYMSGRLRVSGDISAALRLDEIGKRMRSHSGIKTV